jgi:hypothetical protein
MGHSFMWTRERARGDHLEQMIQIIRAERRLGGRGGRTVCLYLHCSDVSERAANGKLA